MAASQIIVEENPITGQVNNQYITSLAFKNVSSALQYVVLFNAGNNAVNLMNWTVTVDNKMISELPWFILLPLVSVTIHFGMGSTNSTDIYLNQSTKILEDQHGEVIIKDFTGAIISDARY